MSKKKQSYEERMVYIGDTLLGVSELVSSIRRELEACTENPEDEKDITALTGAIEQLEEIEKNLRFADSLDDDPFATEMFEILDGKKPR